MKTEWKKFLENAGAIFEDGKVANFGNPVRELRVITTGTVIADLSHWGLIAAHGEDTNAFLQGQFSNDIREISATQSQLSSYCSAKGRVLAIMRVFQHGNSVYLNVPRDILEDTIKRLRMYVLRSKVTLEDMSESFVRIGLSGPNAAIQLQEAVGQLPESINGVLQLKDMTIIHIPGPHPRYEIIGDLDPMQKLWSRLDVHAAPIGANPWNLLDILAGIPSVHKETMDAFVPQMLNLQAIGGVNFKKGCYPGQEIVARMQYLGKLKRRMYLAHVDSDLAPKPGDAIFSEDTDTEQSAGKVVNAQATPDGGYHLLAVALITGAEHNNLHLHNANGPKLQLMQLPYKVE